MHDLELLGDLDGEVVWIYCIAYYEMLWWGDDSVNSEHILASFLIDHLSNSAGSKDLGTTVSRFYAHIFKSVGQVKSINSPVGAEDRELFSTEIRQVFENALHFAHTVGRPEVNILDVTRALLQSSEPKTSEMLKFISNKGEDLKHIVNQKQIFKSESSDGLISQEFLQLKKDAIKLFTQRLSEADGCSAPQRDMGEHIIHVLKEGVVNDQV